LPGEFFGDGGLTAIFFGGDDFGVIAIFLTEDEDRIFRSPSASRPLCPELPIGGNSEVDCTASISLRTRALFFLADYRYSELESLPYLLRNGGHSSQALPLFQLLCTYLGSPNELIDFSLILRGEGRDRMAAVARANEKQIFRPPGVSEVPEKEEVIAEPRYR
jgi:hypothetical protein